MKCFSETCKILQLTGGNYRCTKYTQTYVCISYVQFTFILENACLMTLSQYSVPVSADGLLIDYLTLLLLQVTSEKLCRAQHELHFQAATYLCLLRSIREHVALHQEFHGKGERSVEESAGLVGLKLPQQPGGKGWEP